MKLSNQTIIIILDVVDARNLIAAIEHKLEVCNEVLRNAKPKFMPPSRYASIADVQFELSEQLTQANKNLEQLESDFTKQVKCAEILASVGIPFEIIHKPKA